LRVVGFPAKKREMGRRLWASGLLLTQKALSPREKNLESELLEI